MRYGAVLLSLVWRALFACVVECLCLSTCISLGHASLPRPDAPCRVAGLTHVALLHPDGRVTGGGSLIHEALLRPDDTYDSGPRVKVKRRVPSVLRSEVHFGSVRPERGGGAGEQRTVGTVLLVAAPHLAAVRTEETLEGSDQRPVHYQGSTLAAVRLEGALGWRAAASVT